MFLRVGGLRLGADMYSAGNGVGAAVDWNSLDQWEQLVTSTYAELEMSVRRRAQFSARLSLFRIGRLQLSSVESGPVRYERSEEHLADAPADDLLLSLKHAGSCIIEQQGREAVVRAGDIVLYDTSSPYRLDFPEPYRELIVKIPRAALMSRVATPERFTSVKLSGDTAVSRLAGTYLRELAREADQLPEASRDQLDSALLDMVAVALTSSTGAAVPDGGSAYLLRAKTYMRAHIWDSTLCAARVAAALNISVRTLNRAFAREGESAMRWLLDERLRSCHLALTEGRARSVSDVACEYGFSDLSHFSRVFKAKFGASPSEVKAHRLPTA